MGLAVEEEQRADSFILEMELQIQGVTESSPKNFHHLVSVREWRIQDSTHDGFGIKETSNRNGDQIILTKNKIHQFKFGITTDNYSNSFLNYKKKKAKKSFYEFSYFSSFTNLLEFTPKNVPNFSLFTKIKQLFSGIIIM